jgi:hypothetical protein
MSGTNSRRGAGIAEYIGLIGAVGLVIVGLLAVRPHVVDRRPPVRALPPLVRLLGEPGRLLAPRRPDVRAAAAPRRAPRRRAPRSPRVVVDLPEWLVGR